MKADEIRVIVAGAGFSALRQHLSDAMPGIVIEAIEPDVLRRDDTRALVLIPAMSRIDAELMRRINGLRLIQQWGAGLEGVDLAAANERRIAVANVPSSHPFTAAAASPTVTTCLLR